jgi:hypothetical protein
LLIPSFGLPLVDVQPQAFRCDNWKLSMLLMFIFHCHVSSFFGWAWGMGII